MDFISNEAEFFQAGKLSAEPEHILREASPWNEGLGRWKQGLKTSSQTSPDMEAGENDLALNRIIGPLVFPWEF